MRVLRGRMRKCVVLHINISTRWWTMNFATTIISRLPFTWIKNSIEGATYQYNSSFTSSTKVSAPVTPPDWLTLWTPSPALLPSSLVATPTHALVSMKYVTHSIWNLWYDTLHRFFIPFSFALSCPFTRKLHGWTSWKGLMLSLSPPLIFLFSFLRWCSWCPWHD